MEKKSYTYGSKLAGMILHLFFTVILTIAVYLLASLISKNILQVTDIGTDDFFNSGYYTKCMEQKCSELTDYLHLLQKGNKRSAEDDKRYLQYTNEFKREDTNFCYWYKQNGGWYTNQPDSVEGQEFDTQTVLMEAKTMGDYLIYDMEKKEFGTDIRGMENYFFDSYNNQMYLPLENVVLVIGVDTDLTAKDDLYDAEMEYVRLHPWIKVSIVAALVSLMGWVLSLVYLTLATGHRDGEEGVHLNFVDRIKTEIVTAVFIAATSELIMLLSHVNNKTWNVSGLLVASGTVSLLIDVLFLIFYLSMVRRMKAEVMWENSLVCWFVKGMDKFFEKRTVTVSVLVVFAVHMIVCFVLAMGAFYYHRVICLVLLLIFSGMEAYLLLRSAVEHYQVYEGVEKITEGVLSNKIDTEGLHGEDKKLAEAINNIGSGLLHAVDDSTKNERMKADLITNVSHDIKTPLTSIVNYVDLLKKEEIDNPKAQEYLEVLDRQSKRLKKLTEDLVDASKASSGVMPVDCQPTNVNVLLSQLEGEYEERLQKADLTMIVHPAAGDPVALADGKLLSRVMDNLMNNIGKYAMPGTRVYAAAAADDHEVTISIKNVSRNELNISADELMERFVRGDSSRHTEGSGLGLSIAKSLVELQGGRFELSIDGDLFRADISLPLYRP